MKYLVFINSIVGSCLLIVVGLSLIASTYFINNIFWYELLSILALLIIIRLVQSVRDPMRYKYHLLYALIYTLALAFIYYHKDTYMQYLDIVVGIYALINGVINLIDYGLNYQDISKLFLSIIFLAFAFLLLLQSKLSEYLLIILSGIYLMLVGSFNLNATLSFNRTKLGLSLPVFLSVFFPLKIYLSIDDYEKMPKTLDDDEIEVFFYLQKQGFEMFGHIDIAIGNTIYSYGCHDAEKRLLHGLIGDGVLIKADKAAFLRYALDSGKTMIIGFSLHFGEDDLKIIKRRIDNLMQDTITYKTLAQRQKEAGQTITADDYISRVYLNTNCELYKFSRGLFKTYFVFTTNCVLLVDYLIHNHEINLIKYNGINTPGTYLNYFYKLYLKHNPTIQKYHIYKKIDG